MNPDLYDVRIFIKLILFIKNISVLIDKLIVLKMTYLQNE
ncbi:hypothetical protein yaldo0001_36590 [Yersinia aldovae ATCC 35236]|nr:hypothetical protein yaldo0001_36590 [Yersinia aldovae ATCC 35236]